LASRISDLSPPLPLFLSEGFSTKSSKTATFDEEFSSDIDFDDQLVFKLFDETKVERSDGSVEPVGKV